MSKNPSIRKDLEKVIKTTQSIEGYNEASKETIKEAKSIREKYGIKVSSKR
jgi:hypothetical protein